MVARCVLVGVGGRGKAQRLALLLRRSRNKRSRNPERKSSQSQIAARNISPFFSEAPTSPLPRWHTAARIRSGLSFGPKLFAKPGPTRPPFCGWPTRILARRRGFSRICRRNIELRKSAKKKKKQFYFSVVFLFVGPTVTPSISPHTETKNENAMSSATSSSGSSAR